MGEAVRKQERVQARPFVKWAGGKGQLLTELLSRVPKTYDRYLEPFLGGGALFFALNPQRALLNDANFELIDLYQSIKENVDELIVELGKYRYEKEFYYAVRAKDRSLEYGSLGRVAKAARTLYLNRTCFNGLFRVNSKGHFNVPFGRYQNPRIVDAANLEACSAVLQGAELTRVDFVAALAAAQAEDFVYLDPPYAPLTETANFTSYTRVGFSRQSQEQLRDCCRELDRRGVRWMLSNSATPLIKELYADFKVETVYAARAINSKASRRAKLEEYIVRNY